MNAAHIRRAPALSAAALALAALCLTSTPARAELRTRRALTPVARPAPAGTNLPKLLVVKGGSQPVPAPLHPAKAVSRPQRLSDTAKKSLLTQASLPAAQLGGPFTLTPARPCVEGRAFLIARHSYIHNTDPVTGGVTYIKAQEGFRKGDYTDRLIRLMFTPEAVGRRYLLDFLVGGGTTYYLTACSNGQQQTFTGTSHVTVLYEAATTQTVAFDLTGNAVGGLVPSWQFFGCEITPLN